MIKTPKVALLAGGTGGAKLGRGLYEILGENLTIIANTADDIEIYQAYVSPDPDLCLFWLADMIDERGWGITGDSFQTMEGYRRIGKDVWFQLGDYDLAICLQRAQELAAGKRLSESLQKLATSLQVDARVLPMSDTPVRTKIKTERGWRPFQEFMIQDQAKGMIQAVEFDGIEQAKAPPEVLTALSTADLIIIGPSNPIISIGPILAVTEIHYQLKTSAAPVVAVSPIVNSGVLKGPTEPFMQWAGLTLGSQGIAAHYRGLLDGLISDEKPLLELPCLQTNTIMDNLENQVRLAKETTTFAGHLAT